MRRLIIGMIALALGLGGCVTARSAQRNYLELRISQLERDVKAKDSHVQSLQDKVDEMAQELATAQEKAKKWDGLIKAQKGRPHTGLIRVNQSVNDIQKALKNAGVYKGSVDGKIGRKTKESIVEFQKENGLKADGIVGLETWAKLSEYVE